MLRTAAYCRVSTDREEQAQSLRSQHNRDCGKNAVNESVDKTDVNTPFIFSCPLNQSIYNPKHISYPLSRSRQTSSALRYAPPTYPDRESRHLKAADEYLCSQPARFAGQ